LTRQEKRQNLEGQSRRSQSQGIADPRHRRQPQELGGAQRFVGRGLAIIRGKISIAFGRGLRLDSADNLITRPWRVVPAIPGIAQAQPGDLVLCDSLTLGVTLPRAEDGQQVGVKNETGNALTIVVSAQTGEEVEGGTSVSLTSAREAAVFVGVENGADRFWVKIGGV
jgi:hypothetical protein